MGKVMTTDRGGQGPRTIAAVLQTGGEVLRAAGIEAPRLEARLLLGHALGLSQEALLRDRHAPVSAAVFDALVARRAAHEPLALIVGRREFWGLDLAVSPVTLIPRPETETLIEAAIEAFPDRAAVHDVLDLGTGTGAALLATLSEFPAAFGVGVDLNPAAAVLAAGNAARLGLAARAAFLSGDWAAALAGRFDLVLSNPPYIASGAIAALMPEVARFEPRAALDGGADGLDAYRHVTAGLPRILAATGMAILEVGTGQADAVGAIARIVGFSADVRADLGGIPRAVLLRAASRCRATSR
jgi:release factor glutamine methyltransferase